MGRSIGSGVAVYLASKYKIGHLVLISPFLSIREVVKDLYCDLFSWLLKEKFDNKERIKRVECACLIIHGLKDEIIPYKHSVELSNRMSGGCVLKLVREMSHSNFDFDRDLLWHVNEFLGDTNWYKLVYIWFDYFYNYIYSRKWDKSGERKEWEDSKEREDKTGRSDDSLSSLLFLTIHRASLLHHPHHLSHSPYFASQFPSPSQPSKKGRFCGPWSIIFSNDKNI